MTTNYQLLIKKVNELDDLSKALSVLNWDREVNMPQAGTTVRVQQMTTLSRLTHTMFTSEEMGEMIEAAALELNGAAYDSNEASLIRLLRRTYRDARKLPPDFVAKVSEVSGHAHKAWVQAREDNDFAGYRPWLEQIVELGQEKADLLGYEDEKYDALLDQYEYDMKTAEVRDIFSALKQELIPLREAIDDSHAHVDDTLLHQPFDVDKQREFAHYIAPKVGYDFSRGHLGTVVHPFAITFSRYDSRITTRWYDDFLAPSLFGTLHESGHAIYEQGTDPEVARTPLARGTSLGIHESQSRMMENVVGRSLGFWQAHFPRLQATFPAQLGRYTAEDFYRAINKVKPSFIRVEADELSYNFHIILRFELEQALMNGDLAPKDVPSAWNAKMEELLGVVPPTDSEGCLQDVHWSRPMFGYFPTYALGNLYAAQFFETAVDQVPAIEDELAQGKTDLLLNWLRENIHIHGRKFTPRELVHRVTGQALDYKPFLRYVTAKFNDIYAL
ncbi:MAG: carboxypeptidase M32 [Candidatus Promineifilaceae bacterium]|nr:carboxypeptidase M32 [Candidatus Promineifilaceae bacterium]